MQHKLVHCTGVAVAQAAVPQLMAALKDIYLNTRCRAASALANSGQDSRTWMPVMLELVRHKESYVRRDAIYMLGRIGTKAHGAVPPLLTALADNNEWVRNVAAEALKKIDPEAAAKAGVK